MANARANAHANAHASAHAIVTQPAMVRADEPSGNLDDAAATA